MTDVGCPVCNQTVTVPERYLGKNWKCPACRHRFRPDPAAHPPGRSPRAAAVPAHAREAEAGVRGLRRFAEWVVAFLVGAAAGAVLTRVL